MSARPRWPALLLALTMSVAASCGGDDGGDVELSCPDGRVASVSDIGNPEGPGRPQASDVLIDVERHTGHPREAWNMEELVIDEAVFAIRDGDDVVAIAEARMGETGWYAHGYIACGTLADIGGG